MNSQKIKIHSIIEIAGSPKEHVKKTINKVLDILEKNENIKILKKEVADPKKIDIPEEVKNQQNVEVFSSFTELELEFPNFDEIMQFCLTFMPSSIEIIEPENISINQKDLGNALNELLAKLHEHSRIIMEYQAIKQQIMKARQEKINEPKEK